jgi:hypothetical protein
VKEYDRNRGGRGHGVQEKTIPKTFDRGGGVIAEDDEKPKKEERRIQGKGNEKTSVGNGCCNGTIQRSDPSMGGLLRVPRWTIPEMRCKV